VFCSKGDNITPPQQALGWILDLYRDVNEIRSYGQTIVYTIHETVGHLGIFVSGGIARKEHSEFSSNIDLIDVLPPGLYEAVFEAKTDTTQSSDLAAGQWVMRCEQRTLDDIRALGANDAADERRFATAARVSEMNLALYRTFMQPAVRAMFPPAVAEALHNMHPLRLQYSLFSDENPFMAPVAAWAKQVQQNRAPAAKDNPFVALQEAMSKQIVAGLDAFRDMHDSFGEQLFLAVYGSPALQAAVGIDPAETNRPRQAGTSPLHRQLVDGRIAELKAQMTQGGIREGLVRAMLWVGMPRAAVDERGFEAIRRIRAAHAGSQSLAEFKDMVRDQFLMLLIDENAAIASLPPLLPDDVETRRKAFGFLREVLSVREAITGEVAERLREAAAWFGVDPARALDKPAGAPTLTKIEGSKAS
jgi:hypothetical protein